MSKTRAEVLIELQHRLGPSENTAHLLDWILDLWETHDFLLKRLGKEYTENIVSAVESSSFNFRPHDLVPCTVTPDDLNPSTWN
jgi:hypothetical protein